MQHLYSRIRLHLRQTQSRRKLLLQRMLLPLTILFIISITTTFAQNKTNSVYLSGQITNTENGAPVSDQKVYIQSNIATGGGMSFCHIKYTDVYGFFYDTISTISEKGSLLISAFDVNGVKYETEEFFRFRWEQTYYANVALKVFDPSSTNVFQANFSPNRDTITHNNLSYYFTNESTGAGIASWYWTFGDGSTSMDKNPNHVYEQAGVYDVSLTISTESYTYDVITSILIKKVKVGMREYYHFGGQAFAGYFPVDVGTAFLYKIEEDEFIPIDTTEFDTLGCYYFYQMIEGNYKVKTFPSGSSVHAGDYLPTYFGNVLLWTKAETIKLNATAWEYNINMVPNYEFNAGPGNIDGVVFLNGKNTVFEDVEIILFNESDNCLTYIKSGKNGIFEFSDLAFGTYKILAEVPGKFSYPTSIILSVDHPTVEDISIIVYDEDIYYGISNDINAKLTGLGDPYPNPARLYVNIRFNLLETGSVQVFILNQSGQVVDKYNSHHQTGENLLQMNTSNLSAGMYKVMVLFGNEKHIKSFIKIN